MPESQLAHMQNKRRMIASKPIELEFRPFSTELIRNLVVKNLSVFFQQHEIEALERFQTLFRCTRHSLRYQRLGNSNEMPSGQSKANCDFGVADAPKGFIESAQHPVCRRSGHLRAGRAGAIAVLQRLAHQGAPDDGAARSVPRSTDAATHRRLDALLPVGIYLEACRVTDHGRAIGERRLIFDDSRELSLTRFGALMSSSSKNATKSPVARLMISFRDAATPRFSVPMDFEME